MTSTYSYNELADLTVKILTKLYGYSQKEAEITALVLVEADARGIPSHGVSRLDFYSSNLKGGFCKPGSKPEIVHETPCSLVVDGHDGVGPYISKWAVEKMLAKADGALAAFCSVRNSNHFGIAGYWAEQAALRGMVGLAFTNTRACGIPTYGRERLIGTNPIAAAIPEKYENGKISDMFLLDIATTTVAHGKIEVYDRRKKTMPNGWAVDETGKGTTDATAFEKLFYSNPRLGGHLFLGGEGEESGGHKGYGLGLLVELLCSGLSLGAGSMDTFKAGCGGGITHFFACFSLALFGRPQEIMAHIHSILQTIRNSEKAEGESRIFIHGEKEAEAKERALKNGVELDAATRDMLEKLKAKL
ncbi:MAG: Ldh family oxidoreductase [Spirochaetaceae bacterium]|jgi:LDH2 family malate/lactate/ureidoglycolate dehydrogenase|nr:Ldh family oxidoreductase [Spirochaetaceae bacterium]